MNEFRRFCIDLIFIQEHVMHVSECMRCSPVMATMLESVYLELVSFLVWTISKFIDGPVHYKPIHASKMASFAMYQQYQLIIVLISFCVAYFRPVWNEIFHLLFDNCFESGHFGRNPFDNIRLYMFHSRLF